MIFQLGDRVTWTSQAAGVTRTKIGSIIEVVPAGHKPKKKKKGNGRRRNHESYIVRGCVVHNKYHRTHQRLYWPRVNQLTFHSDA